MIRLLKKKRNNLGKRTVGNMGYGMSMVADLLGHADGIVKDRNNDAVGEHRNKQTNLNIPEQAIFRAL